MIRRYLNAAAEGDQRSRQRCDYCHWRAQPRPRNAGSAGRVGRALHDTTGRTSGSEGTIRTRGHLARSIWPSVDGETGPASEQGDADAILRRGASYAEERTSSHQPRREWRAAPRIGPGRRDSRGRPRDAPGHGFLRRQNANAVSRAAQAKRASEAVPRRTADATRGRQLTPACHCAHAAASPVHHATAFTHATSTSDHVVRYRVRRQPHVRTLGGAPSNDTPRALVVPRLVAGGQREIGSR